MSRLATVAKMGALMFAPSSACRGVLAQAGAEELMSLTAVVSAPFLLKRIVDRLAHGAGIAAAPEVIGFVLAWSAPSLLSALKAPKTVRIANVLYATLSEQLLRRQLAGALEPEHAGSGHLAGVLERLPFSLQSVLDGVVWRAGPLILQVLVSLVALGCNIPFGYAAGLAFAFVTYLALSQVGAARLADTVGRTNRATSRHSAELTDLLQNEDRVAANGTLEHELTRFAQAGAVRAAAEGDMARGLVGGVALQSAVFGLSLLALLITAAIQIGAGQLRVGDFVLVQAFAVQFTLPLGGLVLSLRQASLGLANIEEAFALAAAARSARPPSRDVARVNQGLELRQVSFAYGPTSALNNVSLSLTADQVVAVVGANGAGKSTLARLMAGLVDPDRGTVFADGVPLRGLSPEARVAHVLYVPQRISLFRRSLGENGSYPPARIAPAALAARLGAWGFNASGTAPDLDRVISDHGRSLSGGQVQKLELARLFGIDTPTLILDESTAALDPTSEEEILRTLRAWCVGRLLILVTHKIHLAASADQVLFLQAGHLAGLGRHEDLLRASPDYRKLWS